MALMSTAGLAMVPAVGQLLGSSCLLPAAVHGLRVFTRSTSFMSLTPPRPLREAEQCPVGAANTNITTNNDSKQPAVTTTTAFAWTFAPLARELARTAGGFEHRARWPLGGPNCSTLMDLPLGSAAAAAAARQQPRLTSLSLGSSYAFAPRHFSVVPHAAPAAPSATTSSPAQQQQQRQHEHTAALELPSNELQGAVATSWLSQWLPKAQPRVKGMSRKLMLRQINRKIVARVARRATIGIPVLGFYFVSKLVMKDVARVRSELAAGEFTIAALFGTAVVADVLDLAAQMTIITGLAHANLGMGLASAAALLVAADKASLATAALSFSCALAGESIALRRADELAAGSSSSSSSE